MIVLALIGYGHFFSDAAASNKEGKSGKKSGGGWGTWLKSFVPNKKNQAHLPDDKNPTVCVYTGTIWVCKATLL